MQIATMDYFHITFKYKVFILFWKNVISVSGYHRAATFLRGTSDANFFKRQGPPAPYIYPASSSLKLLWSWEGGAVIINTGAEGIN